VVKKQRKLKKDDICTPDIELVPDAWPRFKLFIKEVTKAGPQHRTLQKPRRANQAKKPKRERA
jgi:hypothetical protein